MSGRQERLLDSRAYACQVPMDTTPNPSPATVGVFDSGVGGLSVLRALHRLLPGVRLVYVADSGHAPYGERDEAYVVRRCERITTFLRGQGASLVVIACNTATAVAGQRLRQAHPDLRFVGVEPGVKPALALTRNGRIAVLATPGTLRSEKFQRLVEPYRGQATVHLQACPGLAGALEAGDPQAPEVLALVERYCAPLREADVDTVVLGCTHYPFAEAPLRHALGPHVTLVDTAEAVARQAARLLAELRGSLPPPGGPARAFAYTTGHADSFIRIVGEWLDFPVEVESPCPAALR